MSNVSELDQFDGNVYQIDTTDPVLGGPTGPSNKAAINLANRTRWLFNALRFGRGSFAAETGTANHYVANLASAPTTLEEGMEVRFQAVNANTGASDFTPNNGTGGPAALPIYGADHNQLQGGEIAALGEVTLRYTSKLNTGSGGAWILVRSTGGIQRSITPSIGDATNAVATMTALFNAADGMATISVAGGSDVTLAPAQYGVAILKLTGAPTANINLKLPAQTGQWIIINNQGGTFNVTAKTTAGGSTGVVIPASAGVAVLVYSDGTNVNFASSAGQSAFRRTTITGVTGATLTVSGGYTPGALILEKNGLWLEPQDFTATDGATVTLVKAALSTDQFNAYTFGTFNVANAVQKSGDSMGGPLALTAGSTMVTPGAQDNSTSVATTASIWAAGSRFGGISEVSANTTLDTTYLGKLVVLLGASVLTMTLPTLASMPATALGAKFIFFNQTTKVCQVNPAIGDTSNLVVGGGVSNAFITLNPGDWVEITLMRSNMWVASAGSAQLPWSGQFGASLGSNGYQKLPSGLIVQWGFVSVTAANTDITFSLPIAFPSVFYSINMAGSYTVGSGSQAYYNAAPSGLSQFVLRSTSGVGAYFTAFGK